MVKREMNLLYLSYTMPKPSSPFRGTFVLRRIEELINQGINPTVVTMEHIHNILKFKKHYSFQDLNYDIDKEVTMLLKIENPYTYTNILFQRNLNQLEKIVKEKKIDLIHAHFIRDGIYALELKKRLGIPYVVTSHGFDIRNLSKGNTKVTEKSLEVLENADKAVFVSESLLNTAIESGYSGKNSTVINNGFNSNIFKPENKKNNNSTQNIGFCGSLNHNKRADKLPEIFNLIKKEFPLSNLIIIGDGPLKQLMIRGFEKYELMDSVIFTGNIKQELIAKYMNTMDAFILPSIKEGFGAVIGESLACGTQVVTSDAGGIPEAVGNAGYLVANGDNFEERFAEQVIYALKNPIPKSTIEERANELTWEKIIKQEIEVYQRVI